MASGTTLCVDQSGSMAPSVVHASIFAAVMASLPVVATKLICFDTAIVDLTDPVEFLFGIQLGGGTDINGAVAYCKERIERPSKAHMIPMATALRREDIHGRAADQEIKVIRADGQIPTRPSPIIQPNLP